MTENEHNLQRIATKVMEHTNIRPSAQYGSVIVILMITSIILSAIRVLQECNKNSSVAKLSGSEQYAIYKNQIAKLCYQKSWLTKMRLRRLVRRELDPDDYKKYGEQLLNSLLEIGENLTDEEIQTLMEASNV